MRYCELCLYESESPAINLNYEDIKEARREPWWFKWNDTEGGSFSGVFHLCESHIEKASSDEQIKALRSISQGWFVLEFLHRGEWGQACEGTFMYCLGFRDARSHYGPMGEFEDTTRIIERARP